MLLFRRDSLKSTDICPDLCVVFGSLLRVSTVGEFLKVALVEFHCLQDSVIKNLANIPDFYVYFVLG